MLLKSRLSRTTVMTNIACNETKSDFDNCAYSLDIRNGHIYDFYTLGLLCNIQPGKYSICYIYLSVFLLICCVKYRLKKCNNGNSTLIFS